MAEPLGIRSGIDPRELQRQAAFARGVHAATLATLLAGALGASTRAQVRSLVDVWQDARLILEPAGGLRAEPAKANRKQSPLWNALQRLGRGDKEIADRLLLRILIADELTRAPVAAGNPGDGSVPRVEILGGDRYARLLAEYELQRVGDGERAALAALQMRRETQDPAARTRAGKLGGAATKAKRERQKNGFECVGEAVLAELRQTLGRDPSGRAWGRAMAADPRVRALPQYERTPPNAETLKRIGPAFIGAHPARRRRRA